VNPGRNVTDPVPAVPPRPPSLRWRAVLALLERLPQAALSRAFGRVADLPVPRPLRRSIIGGFARAVGIDVAEAEHDVAEYRSINEFFVRRLRPGLRRWPDDPAAVASPVDGVIGRHGTVADGRLIQAKGRYYSAADLLSGTDASRWEGGIFITIYLSPRHCHRIHAPVGGTIPSAVHVPGALLPVNAPAVAHVPDLFPRNERVACFIDAAVGRVAVVAVGAYNVGRISTAFDPGWAGPGVPVSNRRGIAAPQHRAYSPPLRIGCGDELMAFHLGSTVILLLEPGARVTAAPPGTEVRIGSVVARR
jgi:phosphatidylserine decarboxylase